MRRPCLCFPVLAHLLMALTIGVTAPAASADEIKLANGDTLRGTVVSLSESTLTLRSENFGELTVPRESVELIGLGDAGLPEPIVVAAPNSVDGQFGSGGDGIDTLGGADVGQLLSNPQVQQQFGGLLGEALGGQSLGQAQQNLRQTQQGYRDLADDLGGLEGDAINSYLQIFDVLGGGLNAAGQVAPQTSPPQTTPPQTTSPQSSPPAGTPQGDASPQTDVSGADE